jgi:putative restriction endonuclease
MTIQNLFEKINCWTKGDSRAPNKPLLLLMALANVQKGNRWLRYDQIERPLRSLLEEFGPPRQSPHPEYAFWRLLGDGLWEIPRRDIIENDLTSKGDAKTSTLRAEKAEGGFTRTTFEALKNDPELLRSCARHLLSKTFPSSLHDQILETIGLDLENSARKTRNQRFRQDVIRIYERSCAICGYDGHLGPASLGLEAAHIKWHAAGGPDTPENGIALCAFHHVAFDRGALSIDETLNILISQDVVGRTGLDTLLLRFVGHPIREPQPGTPLPAIEYVLWHQREVFRHPARSPAR